MARETNALKPIPKKLFAQMARYGLVTNIATKLEGVPTTEANPYVLEYHLVAVHEAKGLERLAQIPDQLPVKID